MARKRVRDSDEFSLFPFLDALSGVIGVLALIIAVMAILGLHESRLIAAQWTSRHGLNPVFIECSQDGLIIHPQKEHVPHGELERGERWTELLREVQRAKTKYIVFLIRPNGIATYWKAREELPTSIEKGFDVIDADVSLDFT